MAKSIITGSSKKKRGRPALYEGSKGKGAPQIGLRLPPSELASIDAWIREQPKPKASRPVAIRRLVELGLKAHTSEPKAVGRLRKRVAGAAELAATAVDILTVGAADADEKASRKRRLKAKGK
jgi:hypothetical protein